MEQYIYRCPVCGFTYFVPAYWVDYAPPEHYEMPHCRMDNGEDCTCVQLERCPSEGV